MRYLTLVLSAAAFVIGAVVAFALASPADPTPRVDRQPAPAPSEGVAVPFAFQGDPAQAAAAWVAEDQANREAASDMGIELNTHDGYVPADADPIDTPLSPLPSATPMPEPSPMAEDLPRIDLPATPSDSGSTADGEVVDLCSGDPTPDYCPLGVGGTILFTLDAMPPFDGMLTARPHHPGTAPTAYYPECEPMDLGDGTVQLGLSVNRPSVATVELTSVTGAGLRGRTIELNTSAHDAAWLEWFESPDASADDPEQWIHLCALVTGLQPGVYEAQATFTDAADADLSFVYPRDVPLELRVGDSAPDQVRRPTLVWPINGDRVLVNATLPSDQWMSVRAIEHRDGPPGAVTCDTEYASPLGAVADGITAGTPSTQDEIPAETREAEDYPYLRDHDVAQTHELFLEEGTDYTLCIYWWDGRGTDADGLVVAVEAIPFGTPEAYRVSLEIQGTHDTWGALNGTDVETGLISAQDPAGPVWGGNCRFDMSVGFSSGEAVWMPADRLLCDRLATAGPLGRSGITIRTQLDGLGGNTYYGSTRVRIDPRCPSSGCVPRDPELVMIPLPDVPAERRMCGSGFGGGCEGEVPMRSAGSLSLLVTYNHNEGNGRIGAYVGEPRFGDTGSGAPDEPYVEVATTVVDRPWQTDATQGLDVTVSVGWYSDSAATLYAELFPMSASEELCLVGEEPARRPMTVTPDGARGTTELRGLCAGARYRVVITDGTGAMIPVWGASGWAPTRWHEFTTDPLEIPVHGRVLAAAHESYSTYSQTAYGGIAVASPHTPGGHARPLSHDVDDDLVATLAGAGWVYDDRRYSACGLQDRSTRFQRTFRDTVWFSHGESIRVEGNATFRRNHYDSDAREWTCTPLPTFYMMGTPVDLEASAVVTIEELMAGVVLEKTAEREGNMLRVELRAS